MKHTTWDKRRFREVDSQSKHTRHGRSDWSHGDQRRNKHRHKFVTLTAGPAPYRRDA